MMKRSLLVACLALLFTWSVGALAGGVGVVNMRQVFDSSPQIKGINDQLNKQFSPERDKIVSLGKTLQENVNKLQKNQAVMDKNSIEKLRADINKEEQELRMAQAQFQQNLFAAQNKAMNDFMVKVTDNVKKIAEDKKLDMVFPQNSLLYGKDSVDITNDLLESLKK